jgi:hypothetical protein
VKIGGICTISALTVTAIGGIEAGGAPATPSAAQVAQSYIAAIGPANAELTKVDAELKALSITATYAQGTWIAPNSQPDRAERARIHH